MSLLATKYSATEHLGSLFCNPQQPVVLYEIFCTIQETSGPGSSVGTATAYGLDGPGIESRWRRDFPHLSLPALSPNQPPVQWVPDLSRG